MPSYPKTSGVPAKAAKRSLVPVFAEVWNSRPHVCRMCGARILEPRTWCFAHIVGKNLAKRRKYDPENVALVCGIHCHERVDKELRPAAMADMAHGKRSASFLSPEAIDEAVRLSSQDHYRKMREWGVV